MSACQPNSPEQKLTIESISDNRTEYANEEVPAYSKFEITFQISNTAAGNPQLPYDPAPPAGIDLSNPKHNGITVDALFLPPGESDWNNAYRQPAFYAQIYDEQIRNDENGRPKEWYYPTGSSAWKVRFAPHLAGEWRYKLSAQDKRGTVVSAVRSFRVAQSEAEGFIRVSPADLRYFEYDSGKYFHALGFQDAAPLVDPVLDNQDAFALYGKNGITLLRVWASQIYGSAWPEWIGGRGAYDGYLPRAGVQPFHDETSGKDTLTLLLDYNQDGDTGWYDACRMQFMHAPEAVKPDTNYRLRIEYRGQDVQGPRITSHDRFGLVGKIGGEWEVDCYQPGTSSVVTSYGGNNITWGIIEGSWNSGANNFLPRIYLGLENVTQGRAYVRSISLREELIDGRLGPEILTEPFLEYELYIPDRSARALDKVVELAENNGVALKLVVMDKGDVMYTKLDDDGSFVLAGERDNEDGFYGLGRAENKTRWLQKAWWRYLQARWGYSTSIHSWELTNEGDSSLTAHYEMADEFGKYMHCGVFGVGVADGDGQHCAYDHPNSHLVTTSFWHSFPAQQFWGSEKYPNVDYADLHAYISTSRVGIDPDDLAAMQWDAALYHVRHSQRVASQNIGKPVVRGEAGIDSPAEQKEQPGLAQDHNGIWLHNFIWSSLDAGGLVELYWWNDNLKSQPGPDGDPGLYEIYRYLHGFMTNIPLNNGHYQTVPIIASNPDLRGVGQIDRDNNRAHLWVQNKNHTWKRFVDGKKEISGVAGTLTLRGFKPDGAFAVEMHAFTTQGLPRVTQTSARANSTGELVIVLPVDPEVTDVAIKIGDY